MRARVGAGAVFALFFSATFFLFVDRAAMPIQLWDESRNIVNALEMHARGFSLVTTYGGAPDLWNTKPPLLIWLMAGSVALFGPETWALRLPSMVAALATIALLFWFVRRTTGSRLTAMLAAALLVLSPAFFGEHSARTADYDALLLFFVTTYLCLLYLALERERPAPPLLALIGAAICCAFLTKSVAALVPGVGVVLYVTVARRWHRVITNPRYAAMALGVAGTVLLFLAAREWQAPGYLHAAWFNDVRGRFGSALVLAKPRWFYLELLRAGFFAAGPLLLLAPVALFVARGPVRQVLLFSLCIVAATLAVFTCAASKLDHYILPAVPFMAVAAAVTCQLAIAQARAVLATDARYARLVAAALLLVALVPVAMGVTGAVARRYYVRAVPEGARSGQYGALFDRIVPLADRPILVVDPGFSQGQPNYTPVLLGYRELWAARGVAIAHSTNLADANRAHRRILASCDAAAVPLIAARGRDIGGIPGCAAVVID
ncbi:ArnT family glycosyltransferase [Sphingomonas sp. MMS24-J45]|uniref:ArnT family glycosyltransferase n=1 Tax=Sphingomonas sp. MMS24-J45 TaxID=3238806 RepID=UPI00384B252D